MRAQRPSCIRDGQAALQPGMGAPGASDGPTRVALPPPDRQSPEPCDRLCGDGRISPPAAILRRRLNRKGLQAFKKI
jgi:hypothetical protein